MLIMMFIVYSSHHHAPLPVAGHLCEPVDGRRLAVLHVSDGQLQVPGRHDPARAAAAARSLRVLLLTDRPQDSLHLQHVPQGTRRAAGGRRVALARAHAL